MALCEEVRLYLQYAFTDPKRSPAEIVLSKTKVHQKHFFAHNPQIVTSIPNTASARPHHQYNCEIYFGQPFQIPKRQFLLLFSVLKAVKILPFYIYLQPELEKDPFQNLVLRAIKTLAQAQGRVLFHKAKMSLGY